MIPPVVAWVDPGGQTGLARLWNQGTSFHAAEYDFAGAVAEIERLCQTTGPILSIGWEAYHIIPGRPQSHAHTAIEMIGVVKSAAQRHGCRTLKPAEPSQRNNATMAMLKALGWWVPAKDDAQAAAQHMLAWMMREGQMTPQVAAVLSEAARRV